MKDNPYEFWRMARIKIEVVWSRESSLSINAWGKLGGQGRVCSLYQSRYKFKILQWLFPGGTLWLKHCLLPDVIQLIRIGFSQRTMVAVKMTDHHITGAFQFLKDPFSYTRSDCDLKRMRQKPVPIQAQGYSGIDEDFPIFQFNRTGKPANSKRFGSYDLNHHVVLSCPRSSYTGLLPTDCRCFTAARCF